MSLILNTSIAVINMQIYNEILLYYLIYLYSISCAYYCLCLDCPLLIDPSVLSNVCLHYPKLSQFDKIQVFLEIWQSSPYHIFYKIGIRVAHVFICLCCFFIPCCFFLCLCSTLCSNDGRCLWIDHTWLSLRVSLTFIYIIQTRTFNTCNIVFQANLWCKSKY